MWSGAGSWQRCQQAAGQGVTLSSRLPRRTAAATLDLQNMMERTAAWFSSQCEAGLFWEKFAKNKEMQIKYASLKWLERKKEIIVLSVDGSVSNVRSRKVEAGNWNQNN